MRYRIATAVLIAVLAGTLLRFFLVDRPQAAMKAAAKSPPALTEAQQTEISLAEAKKPEATPDATVVAPSEPQSIPAKPKPFALAALAEPPAGPEVLPGITPATLLENMRQVFRQYNGRFGGNPVGNNAEITAALNGGNSRQVVFLNPDDGMRINDHGQLIDNWGTPFFFHQMSANEMEIRSAGPDRKMWTRDDLVIK